MPGISMSDMSMPDMSTSGAPDAPVTGAQGRVPQFLVECPFSHALADDPIVFPDRPGASHMHVFFGNDSTDAASTLRSLEAGSSDCDQRLDRASYWAPALYDGETMLTPSKSVAYYRPGQGIDPTTVQPYPPGLKMIAGDAGAEGVQSTAVVAWTCGTGIARDSLPPTCPTHRPLRMLVTFPDCWDGTNLDSVDHHSHVAYSSGGTCPSSHPVPVPQLQFSVVYAFSGDPSGLRLASGPITTGHADFFNAWEPAKLRSEIDACIHRAVICGVTSGRK
ncbi:MAG: hypothetical protein JWL72_3468 [Ilumatobacteraceae bacterium]|nr:hypothetical protein [Ilumatobacteraceae bacterium]